MASSALLEKAVLADVGAGKEVILAGPYSEKGGAGGDLQRGAAAWPFYMRPAVMLYNGYYYVKPVGSAFGIEDILNLCGELLRHDESDVPGGKLSSSGMWRT